MSSDSTTQKATASSSSNDNDNNNNDNNNNNNNSNNSISQENPQPSEEWKHLHALEQFQYFQQGTETMYELASQVYLIQQNMPGVWGGPAQNNISGYLNSLQGYHATYGTARQERTEEYRRELTPPEILTEHYQNLFPPGDYYWDQRNNEWRTHRLYPHLKLPLTPQEVAQLHESVQPRADATYFWVIFNRLVGLGGLPVFTKTDDCPVRIPDCHAQYKRYTFVHDGWEWTAKVEFKDAERKMDGNGKIWDILYINYRVPLDGAILRDVMAGQSSDRVPRHHAADRERKWYKLQEPNQDIPKDFETYATNFFNEPFQGKRYYYHPEDNRLDLKYFLDLPEKTSGIGRKAHLVIAFEPGYPVTPYDELAIAS